MRAEIFENKDRIVADIPEDEKFLRNVCDPRLFDDDYALQHHFMTRATHIEVFYEGVALLRANKINEAAYYHYKLHEGTDRNLAILYIFASIRGYYIDKKIHLQLDQRNELNEIGVIVDFVS